MVKAIPSTSAKPQSQSDKGKHAGAPKDAFSALLSALAASLTAKPAAARQPGSLPNAPAGPAIPKAQSTQNAANAAKDPQIPTPPELPEPAVKPDAVPAGEPAAVTAAANGVQRALPVPLQRDATGQTPRVPAAAPHLQTQSPPGPPGSGAAASAPDTRAKIPTSQPVFQAKAAPDALPQVQPPAAGTVRAAAARLSKTAATRSGAAASAPAPRVPVPTHAARPAHGRQQPESPAAPATAARQAGASFPPAIATHAPAAGLSRPGVQGAAPQAPPMMHAAAASTDPYAAEAFGTGARLSPGGNGQWRLDVAPPGLGPVHIDLGLHGQGVNAQFWVQHPAAAATIQGGLAELRGALASGGLNLGQLGVALGSGRQGQEPERRPREAARSAAPPRLAAVGAAVGRPAASLSGLDVLG